MLHRMPRQLHIHIFAFALFLLFGNKFIEIRRGLLVNPRFIEKISGVNVILADGSSYILPKAKKDAVTAKYIEYITEKN